MFWLWPYHFAEVLVQQQRRKPPEDIIQALDDVFAVLLSVQRHVPRSLRAHIFINSRSLIASGRQPWENLVHRGQLPSCPSGSHPGRTVVEKSIVAVRDYMAAFLDANLLDRPIAPLLTGPSSEYPDVEVIAQDQMLPGKP